LGLLDDIGIRIVGWNINRAIIEDGKERVYKHHFLRPIRALAGDLLTYSYEVIAPFPQLFGYIGFDRQRILTPILDNLTGEGGTGVIPSRGWLISRMRWTILRSDSSKNMVKCMNYIFVLRKFG